jgi:phage tail-like protein
VEILHREYVVDMPGPATPPHLVFSAAWNAAPLGGVHRVSGLRRTVDVVEYQEGTATGATATTKLPGDVTFDPVVLERPLTGNSRFAELANAAAPPAPGVDHRGTLTIVLHDQTGRHVLTCTLHDCWVAAYDVFTELDVHRDNPVVERITVVYDHWTLGHTAAS